MRVLAALVFAASLPAQDSVPQGIVRGDLVEWKGSPTSGELEIRADDTHVYRCFFDGKTYFERERQRISVLGMKAGDKVEMVSDPRRIPGKCYAMMVHVMEALPPPAPFRKLSSYRSTTESIVPRGNLTFSGVVLRVNAERLVLRTRSEPEKIIVLRPDTRYLEDGAVVQASTLRINTRIFVRAGRTFEDEIEAYQVVWGQILAPQKE